MIHLVIFVIGVTQAYGNDCNNPPEIANGYHVMNNDTSVTYRCNQNYQMFGKHIVYCEDDFWDEPPKCLAQKKSLKKKRKKIPKIENIAEDTSVDEDFAYKLDSSCMRKGVIRPPKLPHASVAKYERRKRDGRVFMTVLYSCEENYELENSENNRLFCSKRAWIGNKPDCKYINKAEDVLPACNRVQEGCDHECFYAKGKAVCTCYEGFMLDQNNRKTCHDINECDKDNGGCESICINVPGSYECACALGLQIDSVNGRSCIDINECLLNNGHGPCQDSCHNTWGSYSCSCGQTDGLRGTRLGADGHSCLSGEDDCLSGAAGCSHGCINLPLGRGAYCTCPTGWTLTNDWKTCSDINECEEYNVVPLCKKECVNTLGSYYCTDVTSILEIQNQMQDCPLGYKRLLNNTCADIDECEEEITNCTICKNIPGSYVCLCPEGYNLAKDGISCEDINECEQTPEYCPEGCINTKGSFRCLCPDGYFLNADNKTCEDIDECSIANGNCDQICINADGSFKCSCYEGYELTSDTSCKDVDECRFYDICNSDELCKNQPGSYDCICPNDFVRYEGYCRPSNRCTENNGGCSHLCLYDKYEISCSCPDGYILSHDNVTCEDFDECAHNIHNCEQICVNTLGSFNCQCQAGFSLKNDNATCEDINECLVNNGGCSHICENLLGGSRCSCPEYSKLTNTTICEASNGCLKLNGGCSHKCSFMDSENITCSCPEGYNLEDNGKTCEDINECSLANGYCEQTCVNNEGSYACSCDDGYTLLNNTKCVDVDECKQENGGCNDVCINLPGSFQCSCVEGFILSKDNRTCLDVDECKDINGTTCSHICLNTIGSFVCECPVGYSLNTDGKICEIIDKCALNNGDCEHVCLNLINSKKCYCFDGYSLSKDNKSCEDNNECDQYNGGCAHICFNHKGGYECKCHKGFTLEIDNRTCVDINECSVNNGGCSETCLNLPGSWKCECPNGHFLAQDNVTCIDRDECILSNPCSHDCTNRQGGYECLCPKGYKLGADLVTCMDENECALNNGGCSDNCINHNGTFACSCRHGYKLRSDGRTCEVMDKCANNSCSYRCRTSRGVSECYCRQGYILSSDLTSCIDINECERGNHRCEQICINQIGGYRCQCNSGYKLLEDGYSCADIDECTLETNLCHDLCANIPGSYQCSCREGYKMDNNSQNCIKIKSNFEHLTTLQNGTVTCSPDSRRRDRYLCTITCSKGFKLLGPSTFYCDPLSSWNIQDQILCVRASCPRLPKPERGRYLPERCNTEEMFVGEKCHLKCAIGYRPSSFMEISCLENEQWSYKASRRSCKRREGILRPFIKCPNDMKVNIRPHQNFAHVVIPRPKSNVDWWRYVDAFPAWGKKLEGQFPVGRTIITFQAKSPASNLIDVCRVIVEVTIMEPLAVKRCPESFEVQLNPDENSRIITWPEPQFKPEFQIVNLQKSMSSGTSFSPGLHHIKYIASDASGYSVQCYFTINVKGKSMMRNNFQVSRSREHYLICEGKSPLKISTLNTIKRTPKGCVVRQIRNHQSRQTQNLHIQSSHSSGFTI